VACGRAAQTGTVEISVIIVMETKAAILSFIVDVLLFRVAVLPL